MVCIARNKCLFHRPFLKSWVLLLCLAIPGVVRSQQQQQHQQREQLGADFVAVSDAAYPQCDAVIDVTKHPYNAKGDGQHDDTEAIQQALSDMMGQHKLLYFPAGTYLISKTLLWSKKNSAGRDAWGKNFLCGQHATKSVIRLKDGTCTMQNNR